ncbi:MAG: glycosyltransferase [bacterium]
MFLCIGYYAFVGLGLLLGLSRCLYKKSDETPLVSVIVAARNEEHNIPRLLGALSKQSYSPFEIIIVNDRSTDRTRQIAESYRARDPRITILSVESMPTALPPKKNALHLGITHSKGEILCFTDADCVPPKQWLTELVAACSHDVGLVAGYSPYDTSLLNGGQGKANLFSSRLHRFIEFEEYKGALWSAGSIGLHKGWLCTGRSLAYRKSVYEEIGGFRDIANSISGDDDLLLQLVREKTSWTMRYVTSPESFVTTAPPSTFKEFIQQRTRHFSASKYFSLPMKLFFFTYHSANFLLLSSLVYSIVAGSSFMLALPGLLKIVIDVIQLSLASNVFHAKFSVVESFFYECWTIAYNTIIGPLGFLQPVRWKEN